MPKPLIEFGNKPMILHQIEALAAAGVTDVVLAVNYRPELMENRLAEVRFICHYTTQCFGKEKDASGVQRANSTAPGPAWTDVGRKQKPTCY